MRNDDDDDGERCSAGSNLGNVCDGSWRLLGEDEERKGETRNNSSSSSLRNRRLADVMLLWGRPKSLFPNLFTSAMARGLPFRDIDVDGM